MVDAKEAKRVYMRKWRAANKERIATHQKRYWERKAAEIAAKEEYQYVKDNAQDTGSSKTSEK